MPKEVEIDDQTNLLPRRQLIVVFLALASSLFISIIDQNAIGIMLPTIGRDLNALQTISWAGTSSLIGNTCFQVLYGRMSDIFGRKVVFLSAMGLLGAADICCSFAQTSTQLYVFRGIAGIAGGGITALTMMIVSDIVSLEERGKYQGILGAFFGMGNVLGPFMAAAFIERATWRALFWLITPVSGVVGLITYFILPSMKPTDGIKEKVKKIDYLGVITSAVALISLLIPISGGGSYFKWNSPLVIALLIIGTVSAVLFILVEWKLARLPMMPLRLYHNRAVCAILAQHFLFGMAYYSNLYYLPIYYQNVRGWNAIVSAALTVPFVIGQSCFSILSGQYVSRMKRYGEVIWTGFFMWTLGASLKCIFSRNTHPAVIVVILLIEGAGVGNVFQPTLVAAQAHTRAVDRAVVISVRNFIRSFGGACGLAISATVLGNVLHSHIPESVPQGIKDQIKGSTYNVPDLSRLTDEQRDGVLNAYMAGSRAIFVMLGPLMGCCLLLCFLIKDKGLQRKEITSTKASLEKTIFESGVEDVEKSTVVENRDKVEEQEKVQELGIDEKGARMHSDLEIREGQLAAMDHEQEARA